MQGFFLYFISQVIFSIGIIILFGYLIYKCNISFYKNFGKKAKTVCYITGLIGTPIHESSHAIAALLFRHKITKIKFFQLDPKSKTLGYVCHTYNKKSIYEQIGNFFIGTAPIIIMSLLLYLTAYLLIPELIHSIHENIDITAILSNPPSLIIGVLNTLSFFLASFIIGIRWWIFLIIGMLFSLHMNLSTSDIKSSQKGLIFLLISLFIINLVLYATNGIEAVYRLTRTITTFSSAEIIILLIALLLSLAAVLVSVIYKKITSFLKTHNNLYKPPKNHKRS